MRGERTVIKRAQKVGACFVLGACAVLSCSGQEKKLTETAGVDNTRMGAYRALAELSFQAFQKGDNAIAAELARILERTWDQGEWRNSSDGSYCKDNQSVCQSIDRAMDGFVKPLTGFSKSGRAGQAKEEAAYQAYLKTLASAD
jgi:hypothetical protein